MSNTDNTPAALPELDARITSVLRYWDQLRDGRVAPGRIEISPAAITRHLSRISILERPRAGTVRMRLAGATLSCRAGMELRGMPFRSLFELDDRNAAMVAAETAITTPAITILALSRPERSGAVPEAMMALMPLTDTHGALTRAMAIYSERASATPFLADIRGRFVIAQSWTLDIPEVGPVMGPVGDVVSKKKPRLTQVMRPQLAAQSAPRLEAQDLPHHTRPVFQVIDGGLT